MFNWVNDILAAHRLRRRLVVETTFVLLVERFSDEKQLVLKVERSGMSNEDVHVLISMCIFFISLGRNLRETLKMRRHFDRAVLASPIRTRPSHSLTWRELVSADALMGWKTENNCSRTLFWVLEFDRIGGATMDWKNRTLDNTN